MFIAMGAVFLLLGLLSGVILLLAPLGYSAATPSPVTWMMFPALSFAGYATLAGGNLRSVSRLSAVAGGSLLLLGLVAVVALFLRANGFVDSAAAGSASLWYVAAVGLLFGGAVFTIRRGGGSEPKA